MQYRTGAFVLVILALTFSVGCTTPYEGPAESPPPSIPAVTPLPDSKSATVPASEMALVLTDIPAEYFVRDRSVMISPEVTQLTRDLGWTGGYFVLFERTGRIKNDRTQVRQALSIFPVENMNKVFTLEKTALSEGATAAGTMDEIPFPATGDRSIAYRATGTADPTQVTYTVIFSKKNVFERITMTGTSTDYETLKGMVQKAAEKIR